MKPSLPGMLRRSEAVLRRHLKKGPHASLRSASGKGRQVPALGLATLDIAKMQEGAIATLETARGKGGISKRAEISLARDDAPRGGSPFKNFAQLRLEIL